MPANCCKKRALADIDTTGRSPLGMNILGFGCDVGTLCSAKAIVNTTAASTCCGMFVEQADASQLISWFVTHADFKSDQEVHVFRHPHRYQIRLHQHTGSKLLSC